MPFLPTEPKTLEEILAGITSRAPLATALGSAEMEALPAGLRARAVWSARVDKLSWAQTLSDGISDILTRAKNQVTLPDGTVTTAYASNRTSLIRDLMELGRDLGFADEDKGKRGVENRTSYRRLALVVDTQLGQAYGHADYLSGQDPVVLNEFPAQELVRVSPRRIPRDWNRRWMDAGGDTTMRKIRLKTDPIWQAISRFGNPWPPFDYFSGMGLEDIDRDEAEDRGLIAAGETLEPGISDFNSSLEASVKNVRPDLAASLAASFGDQVELDGDTLRWTADQATARRPAKPQPKKPAPAPRKPRQKKPPAPAPTADPWDEISTALAPIAAESDAQRTALYDPASDNPTRTAALLKIQELRESAREAVSVPAASRGAVPLKFRTRNKAVIEDVRAGAEIVARYTAPENLPASVDVRAIPARSDQRAHYSPPDRSVHLSARIRSESTAAHEITHASEIQNPALLARAKAFLAYRAGSESPVRLSVLTANPYYGPGEVAYDDQFSARGASAYAGKIYNGATELLTMGIERLHADPALFAKEDPEYFEFLVRALRNLPENPAHRPNP